MNKLQRDAIAKLRAGERRALLKPIQEVVDLLTEYYSSDYCVCSDIGSKCLNCKSDKALDRALELIDALKKPPLLGL